MRAGKGLGHKERLGQETLELTGPIHGHLVLLGEFVHAEDRDDVLQFLVTLQNLQHLLRRVVMFLTHGIHFQNTGVGLQGIYGRIDALFHDLSREHRRRVQMGKCGCRCRVGQVIGRHVDGLYGSNRSLLGGGDPLLHLAHLIGQRRLIADRRGHPPQECRHLGSRLCETENIVNEQQHVLMFFVSKILR